MSGLLIESADPATIEVGDRIKFTPKGGASSGWWLVRARDGRWIIATQQVPFKPKGTLQYTVVDLTGGGFGYSSGIARSSINEIGGGWGDGTYSDSEIADMLAALQDPEDFIELSHRRAIAVWSIEVKS